MNIDLRRRLFVGLKLDAAMRSDLAHISPGNRKYVEEPGLLSVCTAGEDKYIGKLIDGGLPTDQVDDVRRNIVSIMAKIFPERRVHSATLRMFATAELTEAPAALEAEAAPDDDEIS
jgi:hypothetical protein